MKGRSWSRIIWVLMSLAAIASLAACQPAAQARPAPNAAVAVASPPTPTVSPTNTAVPTPTISPTKPAASTPTASPTDTPAPSRTAGPTGEVEVHPKILIIGDGYVLLNLGYAYQLGQLAASAQPPLRIEVDEFTTWDSTSSDPLSKLWEAKGTLTDSRQRRKTTRASEAMAEGGYDAVVVNIDFFKQSPWSGYDLGTTREYAPKFVSAIQEAGARPVLHMAWPMDPRAKWGPPITEPPYTFEETAQLVDDIARELGAEVAPAALAWQRVMKERPDLELYEVLNVGSGTLPSLAGTYLGVNVVYATVFGKSPEGLAYRATEGVGVSEEVGAYLQRVAWEMVEEYRAKN